MLLYRYKVSLANDDTGPRFWLYLVNLVCGFYISLGLVALYESYWFWLVGLLLAGISSAAVNTSRLRKMYYTFWSSIFIFGTLAESILLFYFEVELKSSNNLQVLVLIIGIAFIQLLVGLIFFKRFKTVT